VSRSVSLVLTVHTDVRSRYSSVVEVDGRFQTTRFPTDTLHSSVLVLKTRVGLYKPPISFRSSVFHVASDRFVASSLAKLFLYCFGTPLMCNGTRCMHRPLLCAARLLVLFGVMCSAELSADKLHIAPWPGA
jgi:hypothetical protein